MFFDFPKGGVLKETGIPLHADKNGILNLDEDEVKAFLNNSSQTWKFTRSGQRNRGRFECLKEHFTGFPEA